MKKLTKSKIISALKYLTAFLIPLIFILLTNHALDNDSWYVLAEGRYITENSIYHQDVLSMHEGLDVVVQNYGFAVIFYWIFQTFGATGLYTAMLILNFLICFLLYKICMLLSRKNVNLSLLIMVITDLVLALGFIVTRAQMVSFVIFLTLIYILELYIKTQKSRYLCWVPILSFLQINLHASLWLMLFFVMAAYIIGSIGIPTLKLQSYKARPLIIASLIGILVGFINPYGIRMITFILSSYSNPVLKHLVVELRSFSPLNSITEAIVYLCIATVSTLCIFAKDKPIKIRYIIMFFGFLALGLNTVKGFSQFILIMFLPLAFIYKNVKIGKVFDAKIAKNSILAWCGTITFFLSITLLCLIIPQISPEPDQNLIAAVDSIDQDVGDSDKQALRICTVYTGYNTGGYLEYRGYKPYIDPRGEYFIKNINGKEDILKEYSDFVAGKISTAEMLDKYNFDYLLIDGEDDPFYKLNSDRYEELYNNDVHKTKVYKKIES